jgi:alpha-glucosidase (family GH31 glycosyl hydrolase)
MIRAMALEFQDDPSTHNIQDQYMFGDALLVAPVCTSVNERMVYLPYGTWYDYETGAEHRGPRYLRVQPSLDTIPLYVRDNSIIAMGPEALYVEDRPWSRVTLDIRLSATAECTLYDDDERAHTQEIVKCAARKKGSEITLNVGESRKTFVARFNKTGRPKRARVNGKEIPHLSSQRELNAADVGWYFDSSSVVYARLGAPGEAKELVLRY